MGEVSLSLSSKGAALQSRIAMLTCLVCTRLLSNPARLASPDIPERRRLWRLRNHERTRNNQRPNKPGGEGSPNTIEST